MQYENERYIKWVEDSAAYIRRTLGGFQPELAIVLGSGLGGLADRLQNPIPVEYADIPGSPVPQWQATPYRFVARLHRQEAGDLHAGPVPLLRGV